MARGTAGGSQVADLLEAHCDDIARRFVEEARTAGASRALPPEDIIDSLREYLVELAQCVRRDACEDSRSAADSPASGQSAIAASHGEQRFHLGYDLPAVVREYVALRELLSDVIAEHAVSATPAELRSLFGHLARGIADAAVQYGALRDAEMRNRTSKHVAFLAHELRNPLSSARMALSLIQERGEVQPSRALDALERGLHRVGILIDDALVSVRLEQLAELDMVTFDVHDFLQEIASESANDADAKGVELRVSGEGQLEGDRRALRSAVSNLVRNAVKFTREGQSISVTARQADARVIIEVEDACGGLPTGKVQALFDPFVQVGADRSGFGLGLAIAKQATDAHRGELRVHDLPGTGCVFVLDLPAKSAPNGGESDP